MASSILGTPINGGQDYFVNQSIGDFKSALQVGNLSKAALSPLRSLDFGVLNNASFTLANKSQNCLRNSQNRQKNKLQKMAKNCIFGRVNERRASSKSGRGYDSLCQPASPKKKQGR